MPKLPEGWQVHDSGRDEKRASQLLNDFYLKFRSTEDDLSKIDPVWETLVESCDPISDYDEALIRQKSDKDLCDDLATSLGYLEGQKQNTGPSGIMFVPKSGSNSPAYIEKVADELRQRFNKIDTV